jgi:hypothetical protein
MDILPYSKVFHADIKRRQGRTKNSQHMHIKSHTRFLPNAIKPFMGLFISYRKKKIKSQSFHKKRLES